MRLCGLDPFTAAAKTAALAKARNDAKLKQDQANYEATKAEEADNQKKIEELEQHTSEGIGKFDAGAKLELGVRRRSSEENQNVMAGYHRAVQQEQAKSPGLETNAQTTKQDEDNARKQYTDAQKEVRDARKKIESLQQDLEAEKARAQALEQAHNTGAEARANSALSDLPSFRAGRETGAVAAKDAEKTMAAARALENQIRQDGGNAADWTQLREYLETLHALAGNHTSSLGNIRAQLRSMQDELHTFQQQNHQSGNVN